MFLDCKTPSDVLDALRKHKIEMVSLRCTDLCGKWQHVTLHSSVVDEKVFEEGIYFDGSSIGGWKAINESDMSLVADAETAVLDPFTTTPTLIMCCTVQEPTTGKAYSRDPRALAKRAEAYIKMVGIADTAYFGPEAEFFIFDDVRFDIKPNHIFCRTDDVESPYTGGEAKEGGNFGHRPRIKGGYFPVAPVDGGQDMRAEMLKTLKEMGLKVEKHHHEVAPSQHELGIGFDSLLKISDSLQVYKYVVHNIAEAYGKTATFMPKPIWGDNGNGMHVHQSLWRQNTPIFAGNAYERLSEYALYYIGGIIKHTRALNAFTNPATNSYKRLVMGFEAPVLLAYSSRNRSAACRIPHALGAEGQRVEVRFPDPAANPYLAFSAMLMAGIDGIRKKIHPGEAIDKNLYDLPLEEVKGIRTVCKSLEEALEALKEDMEFLLAGDVFSKDLIEGYISIKEQEIQQLRLIPHPVEYHLYYSV